MNRPRAAYTLLELLVVMVIVATLAAITIPAVNSARSVSQRTVCQNHLRQIGMALNRYAETAGGFPPVRTVEELSPASLAARRVQSRSASPLPDHGWTYDLLPFLEMQAIQNAFDTSRPYYAGEANQLMMMKRVDIFQCPATPDKDRLAELRDGSGRTVPSLLAGVPGTAKGHVTDYSTHHGGVLLPDGTRAENPLAEKNEKTLWDSLQNGHSKTILVDEMAGRPALWRRGARDAQTLNHEGANEVECPGSAVWGGVPSVELRAWSADGLHAATHDGTPRNFDLAVNAVNNGVYSFHVRGANVLMADGSVLYISQDVVPEVYLAFSTRDAGQRFTHSDLRVYSREKLYENSSRVNPFLESAKKSR